MKNINNILDKLFDIIIKGFLTILTSFFMTLGVISVLTEYCGITNNIEIFMMLIMSIISVIIYNNIPGMNLNLN